MAVQDRKVHQFAAFVREPIMVGLASVPISQAAVLFASVVPYQGFPAGQPPYALYGWQVDNVQVFCTAIVATAQADVQINGVSVLTGLITPVAGAVTPGVLVAPAARRGKFTDPLQVKFTTNGTGTLTNVLVTVTIRPFPLDNEAA